jgi:hypothetical protein
VGVAFANEVVATEEEVDNIELEAVRLGAGLDLVEEGGTEVEAGGSAVSGASSRITLKKSMGDSKSIVKPCPIASSLLILLALTPASVTLQNEFSTVTNAVIKSVAFRPLTLAGKALPIQAPQPFSVVFHLVIVRN